MRKLFTALLLGVLLAAGAWAKDVTATSFTPQGELNVRSSRWSSAARSSPRTS